MAMNFPASPSVNDLYTYGTRTWSWDGVKWILLSGDSVINVTPVSPVRFNGSTATGTLGNNNTFDIASGAFVSTTGTTTQSIASGLIIAGPVNSLNFSGNSYGTNTGDVTVGSSANGLSLAGQAISLSLGTTSNAGAVSAGDVILARGAIQKALIHPGLLTGTTNRYSTPFGCVSTNITLGANQLYAVQMQTPAPHSGTGTTVSFNVTQTSSATLARIGAYLNGADNLPGVLLFDASTVAVTTTGDKFISVNTPPPAVGTNWWLAMEVNGTLAVSNVVIAGVAAWSNGYSSSSGAPILKMNQMYRTGMTTTQPLPDPFGTPALSTSASVPLLMWNI